MRRDSQIPPKPEQRISVAPERPDHRPDPPPLDEPAVAARLPLPAGLAHERGEIERAADGDPAAKLAELARADAGWNRADPFSHFALVGSYAGGASSSFSVNGH
jgi:hypothetical protein